MRFLDKPLAFLDRISDGTLLIIDVGLCAFVLLAHGGALALHLSGQKVPGAPYLYVTVPLVALMVIAGALAMAIASWRPTVLKVHAVALLGLAAALVWFAIEVIVNGFGEGGFSWSPLILVVLVTYPVIVAQRAFPALRRWRDAPFWVAVAAFVVDLVLGFQVIRTMLQMFSKG